MHHRNVAVLLVSIAEERRFKSEGFINSVEKWNIFVIYNLDIKFDKLNNCLIIRLNLLC